MSEQKRFYIGNIHRNEKHPGVVYACLFDRTCPIDRQLVISADIDYILDAARVQFPGQVEGVIDDYVKKPLKQTKI